MKKINGYVNYGCLAAEKIAVYTISNPNPTATVSEKISLEIPDDWEVWETTAGDTMLTAPWGWKYKADEVIGRTVKDGEEVPCLKGYDKDGKKFSRILTCNE